MQKPSLKLGIQNQKLWTAEPCPEPVEWAPLAWPLHEYGYQTLQTKDESTVASFLAAATTKSALLLDCFFAAEPED